MNEVTINVKAKDNASGPIRGIEQKTKRSFTAIGGAAGLAATAIGVGLVKAFGDSIAEARESNKVTAQTNAVLKSTKGAADISAKGVERLATAISKKTGIDDEAIQSGENLLLTFTGIRNEAGKGNDVFNQATMAITDMSVAMDQDMKTSAIQVGKALNDPIKGMTALRRVGVSFTKSQEDQVKKLVKTGHTLEAQKIILGELRKEFGGSAKAAATWGDKAKVAGDNVKESFGKALLPALEAVSKWFVKSGAPALQKFVKWADTGTQFADAATAMAHGALRAASIVLKAFRAMAKGGTTAIAALLDALGQIPGNSWATRAAAKVRAFGKAADQGFSKAIKKVDEWDSSVSKMKDKVHIKADIRDLQSKVRDAKRRLKETNDTKVQAKIKAEIRDLQAKVRAAKSALHSIKPVNIPISAYISKGFDHALAVARQRAGRGIPIRASGGNVSSTAASGGARGGQVLVGEQGPEIVDLPFGSHVNSNADSQRMMGEGGGGGGGVHFHFHGPVYGDHNALKRALVNMKRSGDLDLVLR